VNTGTDMRPASASRPASAHDACAVGGAPGWRWLAADIEVLATIALLGAVLVVGLATVADYGITVDEFNADDYGPKALAWYTSGFADRSTFTSVENTLWYYGPWFQIATAVVQSFGWADHWTVRHAMNFVAGLAGLAALVPIGRLAVGRWGGVVALALCLTTGYVYGNLFFAPIDVPFLFAMTWATLAIVAMADRVVPSWPATIGAGLLTGLAIATRPPGAITHAYLLGAMLLCALEAVATAGTSARSELWRIGGRTCVALATAWITAIALWPWLQIGNPFSQFTAAFGYFANHPNSFQVPFWGAMVTTTALPWFYVPGQLAVRLPAGFLLLLAAGILFGLAGSFGFVRSIAEASARRAAPMRRVAILALARSRRHLIVWAAVILPTGFIIVRHSTLYDGIRHVLFVIPMLAVIAAAGFVRLLPHLCRLPRLCAAIGGTSAGAAVWMLAVLHPLEYVAVNDFAGGIAGAYGRFDLDYWSVAATVALRRLERRLDLEVPGRFAEAPPSLAICMGTRETVVAPMFGRPWRLEAEPRKADFIIATERWHCGDDIPGAVLIDEVTRFDRAFAWTYRRRSTPPSPDASAPH
jgi:hypothetical protein